MSVRHHSTGRDPWANPSNPTPWQRERERGVILPMVQQRRTWWQFLRGRP